MSEPVWIREDVARMIHRRQIAGHGGLDGVRDAGLLALSRPQTLHACGEPAPDRASLAAACAWGIARTHPFSDVNKRTALVLLLFLRFNGADLAAGSTEKYTMMLRLAAGEVTEAALADWVRSHPAP